MSGPHSRLDKCVPAKARPPIRVSDVRDNEAKRIAFALSLWAEARDWHGTIAEKYLVSRGLVLSDDIAGDAIRFHPALKLDGKSVGAMVALFRDAKTDAPCGIHRTFLSSDGQKLGRKMLGRASRAAIKLDGDEDVTLGPDDWRRRRNVSLCDPLGVPADMGARIGRCDIANFPVLAGVEAITILGEVGDGGANERAVQTVRDPMDCGWKGSICSRAACGRRSQRCLARGREMTFEISPPDPRLDGKVKISQFEAPLESRHDGPAKRNSLASNCLRSMK